MDIQSSRVPFPGCMGSTDVLHIAYSNIGLAPINTAEHYRLAAHLDYHAVKGDVRITSDNKLIMCHDPAFTLDDDGRIAPYDRQNCIPIPEHSFDFWMEKEYVRLQEVYGYYTRVCSFEEYIRICKEYGKIAYITLRENRIPELVAETIRIVRQYDMEHRCIINSFGYDTLLEVRKYSSTIPLSHVQRKNVPLTPEIVTGVQALGNAVVTLFHYPSEDPDGAWAASAQGLSAAKALGIPVHMAQVSRVSDYHTLLSRGVQGVQLRFPRLKPGKEVL